MVLTGSDHRTCMRDLNFLFFVFPREGTFHSPQESGPGMLAVSRLVWKMCFQAWDHSLPNENCLASSNAVVSLSCLLICHKKKSACKQHESMKNLIKIIKVIACGEKTVKLIIIK